MSVNKIESRFEFLRTDMLEKDDYIYVLRIT